MRIGELAKRTGASVQAIRFYERRRLMRTPRRTPAGYRIYTDNDLEVVTVIKKMQRSVSSWWKSVASCSSGFCPATRARRLPTTKARRSVFARP